MAKKGTIHVVSHTHWDREWYCTFEEYRFRLLEHVRLLLDLMKRRKSYRTFHFDGQVAPLFDHIEVSPQDEKPLRKAIREKRIVPGPWYVLADEALVSGESLVWNMRLGQAESAELGCSGPWVGYLPDEFGHVAQMPQILGQFGIDTAFMMRGFSARQLANGAQFLWRGFDGTETFTCYCNYSNGSWLHERRKGEFDPDEIRERVRPFVEASAAPDILLMDGVDHFPPNLLLEEAMKELSSATRMRARHTTLHAGVEAIRKGASRRRLARFGGEIRYDIDCGGLDLNGTLSSRMYLKQANRRVETLLERWAEPFAAFAEMLGGTHRTDELRHARRTLLLNHPHDSICGCSIDRVHRQMTGRFEEAEELGGCVLQRAVVDIAALAAGETPPFPPEYPPFGRGRYGAEAQSVPVVIANARPAPANDVALVGFDLPGGWKSGPRAVETPDGRPASVQVLSERLRAEWKLDVAERLDSEPYIRPEWLAVRPPEAVPGCGVLSVKVMKEGPGAAKAKAKSGAKPEGDVTAGRNWLANSFLKATVNRDGSVNVRFAGGGSFRGLNRFEDGGDNGSGYHYLAPKRDRIVRSRGLKAKVQLVERGPLISVVKAAVKMKVPAGLAPGGKSRSKETAPLEIATYYVIRAGSPVLEMKTVVDNASVDHRLRAVFPTGIRTRKATADSQFCFLERSTGRKPYPEKPQGNFVFLQSGKKPGLCLVNRGLPEYECAADGTLYLTLMRSLSMAVRQWWPKVGSVESRMLGTSVYEYAVGRAEDASDAAGLAERFTLPVRSYPLPPESPEPAERMGFLELGGELRLSTVESSPFVAGAVEVRLYNPLARRATGSLKVGVPVRRAETVSLAGRRLGALKVKLGGDIRVALRAGEIATVRLHPA